MAVAEARARNFARREQSEADEYGHDPDHDQGGPALNTADFDNALRLAHHAQRLKAIELGLEHFSSGIAAFKAEQRHMFRRQTVIALAIGGFCLFTTMITGIIISSAAHRLATAPVVVASAAPLSAPAPAPTMPAYRPVTPPAPAPQAPAPQPTINYAEAPAAAPQPVQQILQPVQQAQIQPAYVQPAYVQPAQVQPAQVQPEQAVLEMPKPVALGRYSETPAAAPPARKLSTFEKAVTQRLAATSQTVPASWESVFAREAAGDARAKLQVAAKFLKGEGVKPDPDFAVTLIRQAARSGNTEAMMWLAYSYEGGSLGKTDPVSAAHWFSEAAKAGVTGAYAELGKLYEKGVDGAPDNETALSWYQRAVKAGDAQAAGDVQRLNRALLSQNGLVAAEPAKPSVSNIVPLQPMAANQPRDAYLAAARQAMPVAASVPVKPPANDNPAPPDADRMGDIRAAQRMLKVLGYKIDKPDGALSTQTQAAIRSYQRDHAAYPDGQFTPELLDNLTRDIRFGQ